MQISLKNRFLFIGVAALLAAGAGALSHGGNIFERALASENEAAESDHDRAHAARQRGDILPLQTILASAKDHLDGKIAEIEYEEDDGVPVYEIKLINPRGRLVEIYLDARTGKIIKIEDDE
ncbi:MAG: hypothetical protein C0606_02530 [Hyphomicrobiales bacterium]|nr:MAG: hypothetical protein C0606_02530 [Hyphomicrobiales bacterium]